MRTEKGVNRKDIQNRLEGELTRLKAKLGLGGHLRVLWDPRDSLPGGEHGRVTGNIIHVYDRDWEEALHTVRHEFWEYILTREFLEPRVMELRLHRRGDALVDILADLI